MPPPGYAKMEVMRQLHYLSFLTFLTCLTAALVWLPASAHAQRAFTGRALTIDDIQTTAYIANPKFEQLARAARMNQPPGFNFTNFRRYYAMTRQYDPLGERTINRLRDLAFAMSELEETDENYAAYHDQFELLFLNHMAHLGVVLEVSALARGDARFGDIEFLEWLKEGLIDNLLVSGDGYSLDGAYDVITLSEEVVLFNRLNMKVLESTPAKEYRVWYNMHSVVTEDEQPRTIFVNTTFPMRFMEARRELDASLSVDMRPALENLR